MVQVKDLTQLTLRDLWAEVQEKDDWWGDVKEETLRIVQMLLESSMQEELVEQLRAGWYRRSNLRRGYRNGYRYRDLLTEMGLIEHLRVPRGLGGDLSAHHYFTLPATTGEGESLGAGDVPRRSEHPKSGESARASFRD